MKRIAFIIFTCIAAAVMSFAQQPEPVQQTTIAVKSAPTLAVKAGSGGAFCANCKGMSDNWLAIKELQAINQRCSDAVQITDSDKADYHLVASFGGLIHNSAMLFDKDGKLVHEFKTGGRMSKSVCQYFEDLKTNAK